MQVCIRIDGRNPHIFTKKASDDRPLRRCGCTINTSKQNSSLLRSACGEFATSGAWKDAKGVKAAGISRGALGEDSTATGSYNALNGNSATDGGCNTPSGSFSVGGTRAADDHTGMDDYGNGGNSPCTSGVTRATVGWGMAGGG